MIAMTSLEETSHEIWPSPINTAKFVWPVGGCINGVPLYHKSSVKHFSLIILYWSKHSLSMSWKFRVHVVVINKPPPPYYTPSPSPPLLREYKRRFTVNLSLCLLLQARYLHCTFSLVSGASCLKELFHRGFNVFGLIPSQIKKI